MRHALTSALGLLLLLTAGCFEYPRDIEGTTARVLDSDTFRAGIVSGVDAPRARSMAQLVAIRTEAEMVVKQGPASQLLRELENGNLDLVIGEFAKKGPWRRRAVMAAPPAPPGAEIPGDEPVLRPVLRKGENRWYMFVEDAMQEGAA